MATMKDIKRLDRAFSREIDSALAYGFSNLRMKEAYKQGKRKGVTSTRYKIVDSQGNLISNSESLRPVFAHMTAADNNTYNSSRSLYSTIGHHTKLGGHTFIEPSSGLTVIDRRKKYTR
jgi:hypothetical protein